MSVLKVTTVGNSVGVILPKEILERPQHMLMDSPATILSSTVISAQQLADWIRKRL